MASDSVLELTDGNFDEEVIQSDIPVLVDFWAEWCMPCKMIAPVVEELAGEYAGKAKVGQMGTDSNRQTGLQFRISALPTLLLFNRGEGGVRHQREGERLGTGGAARRVAE